MSEKYVLLTSRRKFYFPFLSSQRERIKKMLMSIVTLLVCVNASAFNFTKNGWSYDVISEDTEKKVGTVKLVGANYSEIEGFVIDEVNYDRIIDDKKFEMNYTVVEIGSGGIWNCPKLTSLTIGNSVMSIGSFAFGDCDNLKSVRIGNSVTYIGEYAFKGCDKLSSVSMPNSLTTLSNGVFYGCNGLITFSIPNSVTAIGDDAFRNCGGLISVEIPGSVTKIGKGAFFGCRNMTDIIVDDSNTQYSSIDGALYTKNGEELVVFPGGKSSATFPNTIMKIGDNAFWGCSVLTSVEIPNSVITIEDGAFWGCVDLASVTIGSSVSKIGDNAFGYCRMLRSVYCKATTPPVASDNIFELETLGGKLHVPTGYLKDYESKAPWCNFSGMEEADFSGVASLENTAVSVVANGGNIEIQGMVDLEVEVYNLSGQLVYRGTDTVVSVPAKGLYIVRVDGKIFKVML